MRPFLSEEPEVVLVNGFTRAFDNAVAAARTCYSPQGIVTAEEVAGERADTPEKAEEIARHRVELAKDIFDAGHHTVFQHAHFQFAINGISRHFVWSFLHSHPFYNSEQVSQRYVEVKPGNYFVPMLDGEARSIYEECVARQMDAYHRLMDLLAGPAGAEYFRIFPARAPADKKWQRMVKRKAQEIARYVLPIATYTYLYHTISGITLLRYHRLCNQLDTPVEQRFVVKKMVDELLAVDPLYAEILEEPVELEETQEFQWFAGFRREMDSAVRKEFRDEFDAGLGGRWSKLVDYQTNNEALLAQSVREVLGVPSSRLTDDEAIEMALNPARNRRLAEALNLTTHDKISRAMFHPHYTFRKKLSHTGDSQDQRHRMTPASRPVLQFHLSDEPDCITPELVNHSDEALKLYTETMAKAWDAIHALRRRGVGAEEASYLLPNAVSIRFTESSDLLNLWHKHALRLCYNAQEEIWRASKDEAEQVREVNPRIGKYLLPPCGIRQLAGATPFCPEGERYCGITVWKLDLSKYTRVI